VPPPVRNVIPLRPPGGSRHDLPVPLERLSKAAQELDSLRRCIEPILSDLRWSALEWRVACAPLLVRLPAARQSLEDLADVRAGRWPDTDWAVRLQAARDEVERRLLDVSMSLSSLLHTETSSIDAVAGFSFEGAKLAEAAEGLCSLLTGRYPVAVGSI
jgi:hypothetical protein